MKRLSLAYLLTAVPVLACAGAHTSTVWHAHCSEWAWLPRQVQAPVGQPEEAALAMPRFEHVDVFVDSGQTPLAAYQVEITGAAGRVALVGIEGGESAPFKNAPFYDPDALQHERVIIGAFSTEAALPTGQTRVARLHVRITGEGPTDYTVNLMTAATTGGTKFSATARVGQGDDK